MWRTFRALVNAFLDLLLPRKERIQRLDLYSVESLPIEPEVHEVLGVHITCLMSYRDPMVEDIVRTLKFDHADRAAQLLSAALADYLQEEIARIQTVSHFPIYLAPVPLHASRERERGFNQVARILSHLPAEFRNGTLSHTQSLLTRTRATRQQARLSRHERLTNVRGAFQLSESAHHKHVILIDDVMTTGATLKSAALPLQQHAASVTLLALARA